MSSISSDLDPLQVQELLLAANDVGISEELFTDSNKMVNTDNTIDTTDDPRGYIAMTPPSMKWMSIIQLQEQPNIHKTEFAVSTSA